MYPYISHTQKDIEEMLQSIGVDSIDELFSGIPKEVALSGGLKLPRAKSEEEVRRHISSLAMKNQPGICFLGGGAYDHYVPSVINALLYRTEFYTSYTPYQPEISQGTLQYIFEYQSMICRLTGMDVANASVYDGSNAVAEAALMAHANAKGGKILVSQGVNPSYRKVLKTYAAAADVEVLEIPLIDGWTDKNRLKKELAGEVAGFILQSPNYLGIIEEVEEFSAVVHENKKATMILATDPLSLGILEAPGNLGVDVVVGEAQSLGIPLNLGGPYIGFMAATKKYMRKLPGRICGQTVDLDGKRSFVLTLTAREQHIRRARATSNICSNQGLNTLAVAIYLSVMGREGLWEVASQSLQKAHYLAEKLTGTGKFELLSDKPFFKEFAIVSKLSQKDAQEALMEKGYLGAQPIEGYENAFLVAVTERRTKEEMDAFVEILEEAYDQKVR